MAVWPFRAMSRSHWVLLALVVLFLCIYLGLISWGRVQDSLESIAAYKSGSPVFQANVDRADAIFIVFMFLMLTPLVVVALGTTIALAGAVLTGFLESLVRRPATPGGTPGTPALADWTFTVVVYVGLALAAFFSRALWLPEFQGFLSLIARAILAAYH